MAGRALRPVSDHQPADERRMCGRRSRVVLTPRRRRQVCGRYPADDGDKKARSPGRSRRKPLKPLRAGMPGDFRCDRCEYSCASSTTTSHTRLRVHWAPGIPHALFLLGGMFEHNSGASRRGNAKLCSMSSTAPHTSSRHPRHRVSPLASPLTGFSGYPVITGVSDQSQTLWNT